MGFEVWIVILLAASALSGCIGYFIARKGSPKQSDLDALTAELEEARNTSESVASNVNEHFEQSALLFGKLAADYREFLDHFSSSAQSLGLSEARAREMIERGFQPLLTDGVEEALEPATPAEPAMSAEAEAEAEAVAEVGDVTVEMPEDERAAEPSADTLARDQAVEGAEEVASTHGSAETETSSTDRPPEIGSQSEADEEEGGRQRSA